MSSFIVIIYCYDRSGSPNLADRLVATPLQAVDFQYDDNGNILSSGGRTYQYTSFNKPNRLSNRSQTAFFAYGSDKGRISKIDSRNGGATKTTLYFGAYQKITDLQTGKVEHKYRVVAGGEMVAVYSKYTMPEGSSEPTTQPMVNYLHRDALGSVIMITDADGGLVEHLAYTPFAIRRDVAALEAFSNYTSLLLPSFDPAITKRGFTGHEHIDELDLVHMNGRVYDPYIGRFLSPDPHVQMPKSTQGLNRYAYVQNNPLKYTDPSGYFIKRLLKKVAGFIRKYASVIVAIAVAYFTGGILNMPAWQAGMAAGFSGAVVGGGNLRDALKGAFWGAVSAGWAKSIGHGVLKGAEGIGRVLKHDLAQGTVGALRGGRFKDGFVGGFVGHVASDWMPQSFKKMGDTAKGFIARTTFASMVGGFTSKMGGGKFQDGAWSAAFTHMFNAESPEKKGPSVLGFIEEEVVNVLLRTGQVIGGAGQVLLGAAICTGGVTCAAGGVLGLKGADNIQAGLHGTDSVSKQLLVDATGSEQAGTLINAGLDLGTSVGGLVRSVPKINSLGNPHRSLFIRDSANFEPAFNRATRDMLIIEAFASGSTVYGTLERDNCIFWRS